MELIIKEKWNEILQHLKNEYSITDVSYRTWLLRLHLYSVEDHTATIAIDDEKIGNNSISFISNRYSVPLQVSIEEVTGYHVELNYILKSSVTTTQEEQKSKQKISEKKDSYPFLNSRYTFDTFVVGGNNQFAHAAALAVAESPAQAFNPLFIYGGVGLGKTHLMHSIAWYIVKQNKNMQVRYATSEEFTNDVIHAIRTNKNSGDNNAIMKLKKKYRDLDVLLVDDIQFIIGKESTQEEFFHTFNTLYESNKQIIISSDRPPKDIKTLEERLRSRFEMGLTVDIGIPDYETRMAILKKKEEMDGITMDNEIFKYIASNVKSNIRELEGAFTKVVALSRLQHREINIALAEEALRDIISPDDKVNITVEYITEIVSEHFNISSANLLSSKKSKDISYPRQICMYLCRDLTDISLKDIGQRLGNRDHTTILHGINKITEDIKKDFTLSNTLDILIKKINPQ